MKTIALLLIGPLLCAGCGARDGHGRSDMRETRLRIAIQIPDALQTCRYATTERRALDVSSDRRRQEPQISERAVRVDVGESATEQITQVLEEAFIIAPEQPELVARPRVASFWTSRSDSMGAVDAHISYGVEFRTPSGEQIADVTGSGSARFDYPFLVDLFRLVLHIGTLFLFDQADSNYAYGHAFRDAEEQAADSLRAALRASGELRAYASALRAGRKPAARDVEIDRLLDTVLARRPGTVAVLDLEPIAGAPTMIEAYLAEELRTRLARKGVQTLERAALVHALEELQLNMTDLVDPAHAQRFGQLVAADAILTGSTARFPHEIKISLRLLATETGDVIGAGSTEVSTHGAFPEVDGSRRVSGPAPACPARPSVVWAGPAPSPTPAGRGARWRPY